MKNVYVYNENIGYGESIINNDGTFPKADKVVELTDEQAKEIKSKIVVYKGMMSRCIRVFRDGLIIDGDIYNICFSCGDIKINDEISAFDDSIKETLRNLLNNEI